MKAKELFTARKDLVKFEESKSTADSTKARAETELLEANHTVRDLKSMIEESNSKVKSQVHEFKKLKEPLSREGETLLVVENMKYEEVMSELELVKQELIKLKLDMVSVTEEKTQAENEADTTREKLESYSISMEALMNEIEEVNEELVLVELARMEAVKEHGEIQAERETEERKFMKVMEGTRKKIEQIREEIEGSKEVEEKLSVTLSDIEVLQVGLQLSREMEKRNTMDDSLQGKITAAKKELSSIKEEGFQVMTSMDVVRTELQSLIAERIMLQKSEEKFDMQVQNLHSNIIRIREKLECASKAEEDASFIAANLSATLGQLRVEKETAEKEKEKIHEEIKAVKEEMKEMENQIEPTEERLQTAMEELEAAKLSEASALEKLRILSEKTMKQRALASRNGPWIKIPRFEYDYLQGAATRAEEIAEKKVAAAESWVEALKASEVEMLMKRKLVLRELEVESVRRVENLGRNFETDTKNLPMVSERKYPRKSTAEESGPYSAQARRFGGRRSGSSTNRNVGRSASITLKRRPKVMPNYSKIFSEKNKT